MMKIAIFVAIFASVFGLGMAAGYLLRALR